MTYREFYQPLTAIYPPGEAQWIARLVFELKYGLTREALLMGSEEQLDANELLSLQQRLLTGCPVQYVLGQATFCGRTFYVEPGVLIPRPETEELCHWVIEQMKKRGDARILDIGTGSGCIACTLACELPAASLTAWDVSAEAICVARDNARRLGADIDNQQVDVLTAVAAPYDLWDVIVSNPPYVCDSERTEMHPNVLKYEPSLALFVPDDDPLLFYRAIAGYALKTLSDGGQLFFEANASHTADTAAMLLSMGFSLVEVRDDQFEQPRLIRACK